MIVRNIDRCGTTVLIVGERMFSRFALQTVRICDSWIGGGEMSYQVLRGLRRFLLIGAYSHGNDVLKLLPRWDCGSIGKL